MKKVITRSKANFYHLLACVGILTFCLVACGSDDSEVTPVEVCHDIAVELHEAYTVRCQLSDWSLEYIELSMECSRAIKVRDIEELRDGCFNWLRTEPCLKVDQGPISPFCSAQIDLGDNQ